jgi:hypothetical protein
MLRDHEAHLHGRRASRFCDVLRSRRTHRRDPCRGLRGRPCGASGAVCERIRDLSALHRGQATRPCLIARIRNPHRTTSGNAENPTAARTPRGDPCTRVCAVMCVLTRRPRVVLARRSVLRPRAQIGSSVLARSPAALPLANDLACGRGTVGARDGADCGACFHPEVTVGTRGRPTGGSGRLVAIHPLGVRTRAACLHRVQEDTRKETPDG